MTKSTLSTDHGDNRGLFALIKGDSGAGKSNLALSFPGVYVMDFDRKMPSIAKKHFPGKEIFYDDFPDIFAVAEKFDYLQDHECPYETIFCDSITALTHMIITSIAKIKGEETPKMLKTLQRTKTGGKMIEMMGYDYYNGEARFIKYFLDVLKSLWVKDGNPKHVLISAHVITKTKEDFATGRITTTRSIVTAGVATAAYIPTVFDETYHVGIKTYMDSPASHICYTQAVGEEFAKTAYRLPAEVDFTNKNFFDLVSGYLQPSELLV